MKKGLRKTAAVVICILTVVCLCACGQNSGLPEYEHYDIGQLKEFCINVEQAAKAGDEQKLLQEYDKLYNEYLKVNTMYEVAYLKYCGNMADKSLDEEQEYSYDLMQEAGDLLSIAGRSCTESRAADAFKEHVGDEVFEYFEGYEDMDDFEKKLSSKEQKLIGDYYDAIDETEDWPEKKAFEKIGPIYVDLVKLRNEEAEYYGYDNYADYAHEAIYGRDYTHDDIEGLRADIKKFSSEYYKLSTEGMWSVGKSEMSGNELMGHLSEHAADIGKTAEGAAELLVEEKMYNIGSGSSRQSGAFTTLLESVEKPFLFQTLEGEGDFITLTHEFGHFAEYYAEKDVNYLVSEDNIDLSEIASNGMQVLYMKYYDEIFPGGGDSARASVVDDLLDNVVDGAVMDEFQEEVYKTKDLTPKKVNDIFASVYGEYNSSPGTDSEYTWMYISHNFDMPMYYISYSVSGLAALQIWNRSRTDMDAAAVTWEKLVNIGSRDVEYLEVLKRCNMKLFNEPGVVGEICEPALNFLKKFENTY